ncbi:MAG: ATP synthase F1 subunit delta [Planctomycetota bacterium]|jgi:F-type H+-transporting ATPase subunit delta
MINRTLARRYARALLDAAHEDGDVEEVESTLLALKEVYRKDPMLRLALHQPKISRSRRKEILKKPFVGMKTKAFLAFLDLLIEKNRIALIPEIADCFDRLADALAGIVRVEVRSWKPLDEKTRSALQDKLTKLTNRKVELQEKTDPAVKGGMLVKIGDTVIDGTVAYRLKELREQLLELQKT